MLQRSTSATHYIGIRPGHRGSQGIAGFSRAEVLVCLTILVVIAAPILKIVYGEQLGKFEEAVEEAIGFSAMWIVAPIAFFVLAPILFRDVQDIRIRRSEKRTVKRRRLKLPDD